MSGSLFDIVGPIMVGPSSSHTAGAVRLASLAKRVAGSGPGKKIKTVEFVLYNSFAQTYQGHGTDRGLLAGILGMEVNDERIRSAFEIAADSGLQYKITPFTERNNFSPNTVVFKMELEDGEILTIVGHSLGGGKVILSRINDYAVALKGELPTLILFYKDQPGMIWQVTKILAEHHLNIATLTCTRKERHEEAFMSICLDSDASQDIVDAIRNIPDVYIVRHIEALAA